MLPALEVVLGTFFFEEETFFLFDVAITTIITTITMTTTAIRIPMSTQLMGAFSTEMDRVV